MSGELIYCHIEFSIKFPIRSFKNDKMKYKDLIFKICIFGDNDVGKTSLMQKYAPEMFNIEKKPPSCINIAVKDLTINSTKVTLQIWILGSTLDFKLIMPIFGKGSTGGIFMFDVNNYSSLINVKDWLIAFKQGLSEERKKIPILMVGGKLDLQKITRISQKKGKKIAKKFKFIKYFECSAKTGENVDKIFTFLTRAIMKSEGYI